MTTYRLMAEKIADYVCQKEGIHEKCTTADIPLPGGDHKIAFEEFREINCT